MWKPVLSILLIAMLQACEMRPPHHDEQANGCAQQKITVAFTSQPQSTLVHVAMVKGYFAAQGLDVQPLLHTYGRAALQSVIEGKADLATVAETPVMFSILKGDKIFVIANIEASNANNEVVARRDAGISVAADLVGKRIGFTPGTTSDFFLDSLLTAHKLTRRQIRGVALKPEEMQHAIMAQEVDAVSTWNYPLTQIKQQLGANGSVFYDRQIYTETFNIAAMQDFVRQNPKTIACFLRAVIQAETYVAWNQEDAQTIVAVATKVDKGLVRAAWGAFNYQVVLHQTLLITLEDETRWAIRNKLTDKTVMPDYLSYIHLDSLRAVKPEAINMTR